MSAITGIVAFILIAILLGRGSRKLSLLGYFAIVLIALAQVAVVLYFMMTMEYPSF